jgi:hypothetical protein
MRSSSCDTRCAAVPPSGLWPSACELTVRGLTISLISGAMRFRLSDRNRLMFKRVVRPLLVACMLFLGLVVVAPPAHAAISCNVYGSGPTRATLITPNAAGNYVTSYALIGFGRNSCTGTQPPDMLTIMACIDFNPLYPVFEAYGTITCMWNGTFLQYAVNTTVTTACPRDAGHLQYRLSYSGSGVAATHTPPYDYSGEGHTPGVLIDCPLPSVTVSLDPSFPSLPI